jgi:hypothetical protein
MSQPADDPATPSPRRPPAAPSRWATVTTLGTRSPEMAPLAVATGSQVDGSLALDPAGLPCGGTPQTPELTLVAGREGADDEVQVWAARFAQAVVEVLGGDRPLAQLVRWTSQRVYLELDRRLTILARTSSAGRRRHTARPQVRSVHVFRPTPESAEVSVHVRQGSRSRAIAARLELTRGRWQCTALQLG